MRIITYYLKQLHWLTCINKHQVILNPLKALSEKLDTEVERLHISDRGICVSQKAVSELKLVGDSCKMVSNFISAQSKSWFQQPEESIHFLSKNMLLIVQNVGVFLHTIEAVGADEYVRYWEKNFSM